MPSAPHFCPSGSGSGSEFGLWIRIRIWIQRPQWIWIQIRIHNTTYNHAAYDRSDGKASPFQPPQSLDPASPLGRRSCRVGRRPSQSQEPEPQSSPVCLIKALNNLISTSSVGIRYSWNCWGAREGKNSRTQGGPASSLEALAPF